VSGNFDQYAEGYDAALDQGISVSGEDKSYFARGRAAWLARSLRRMQEHPQSALEFGCGTGSSVPFLFDLMDIREVVGVDVSSNSLDVARRAHEPGRTRFLLPDQYEPRETMDLAFTSGVFHHIWPDERRAAMDYVFRSLRPGGLFSFWENNPWNPGARYVMSRIPFDRDAVPVSPVQARRLLRAGGFEILQTDFLFIFPRALRWLRSIEPLVSRLPLGAQYQVLCRRP